MHFSFKSIVLYVGMISFFIFSFGAISRYGSRNLQAPQDISGEYQLDINNIPACLSEASPPVLVIGQSGKYLNAALLSGSYSQDELNRALRGNGKLSGEVAGTQLTLHGESQLHLSHPECQDSNQIIIEAMFNNNGLSGDLIQSNQTISFLGLPIENE